MEANSRSELEQCEDTLVKNHKEWKSASRLGTLALKWDFRKKNRRKRRRQECNFKAQGGQESGITLTRLDQSDIYWNLIMNLKNC